MFRSTARSGYGHGLREHSSGEACLRVQHLDRHPVTAEQVDEPDSAEPSEVRPGRIVPPDMRAFTSVSASPSWYGGPRHANRSAMKAAVHTSR